VDFSDFVKRPFDGQKYIAHCYPDQPRRLFSQQNLKNSKVLVLIGPEGDFSEEEVQLAVINGFEPISLGVSRLRTETAALVACHTVHVVNSL
jgi:16S rRNA (uracil1498-N3)-methyltransferase